VRAKTPLAEDLYFLPDNGARKELDAWLMTSPLGTPRGRCDEYSSKVSPQLRNQGMSIKRGANKQLKVMLASLR
jgi:hypothetical protein